MNYALIHSCLDTEMTIAQKIALITILFIKQTPLWII